MVVGAGSETVVNISSGVLVEHCWQDIVLLVQWRFRVKLKTCGTKQGRKTAWGWFDTIFDYKNDLKWLEAGFENEGERQPEGGSIFDYKKDLKLLVAGFEMLASNTLES